MFETEPAGCGCCGDVPTCGKMPDCDAFCETLGGENIVGKELVTKFSNTLNLIAVLGPLLSGCELLGPWPGGGAEGMGMDGSDLQ